MVKDEAIDTPRPGCCRRSGSGKVASVSPKILMRNLARYPSGSLLIVSSVMERELASGSSCSFTLVTRGGDVLPTKIFIDMSE